LLAPRVRPKRQTFQLRLEGLETRQLLAVSPLAMGATPIMEVEPNDTLDLAQCLGDLSGSSSADVLGTIGNGPAGAADVDWYSFTLDRAASVHLDVNSQSTSPDFHGVLSLYNSDPYDFQDPYDPIGHRLMEQDDGSSHDGPASIDRLLGPGTYDVAVSGAGNLDFYPFLAGSGFPGQTGDYELAISATDLAPDPGSGPTVLVSEPAAGAVLSTSPLALRIDLSGPVDPSTINAGEDVQLIYSSDQTFQNCQQVSLSSINFASAINELQLFPTRALVPGYYQVILDGQTVEGVMSLADPSGIPLGADATHSTGQDFTFTFQIDGIEGNTGPNPIADDTPAGAHDLGDVTDAGRIRAQGTIGADPFYDPTSTNPQLNPGNDVNMYHFRIQGPGRYALISEVFAGRIGSPLDPGESLYRLDADGQTLDFVAGNNNSYNDTVATDWSQPLAFDSVLSAGLTQGDYYLAVSSSFNTPSPMESQPLGAPGLFNPTISHSGTLGTSTGDYVLILMVEPTPNPPHVVASSPAEGETLNQPPTQLMVQFDEPMNINTLAFQAYQQVGDETVSSVYVEGSDGTKYYPRLESFDTVTNRATFLMLDGLPPGDYALHLSGAQGLTDLGGNPLVGDTPGGDEVIDFNVAGPGRGITGDCSSGFVVDEPAGQPTTQNLGVLFPHEWQAGITVVRDATGGSDQTSPRLEDVYDFQVLQDQTYTFTLLGDSLPDGIQITLTDDAGSPVSTSGIAGGQLVQVDLQPGSYALQVGGWDPSVGSTVAYKLKLAIVGVFDNPPPLSCGPAPSLVLHFDAASPVVTPTNPVVFPEGPSPVLILATTDQSSASNGLSQSVEGPPANLVEKPALDRTLQLDEAFAIAQCPGSFSSPLELASLGMGPLGGAGSSGGAVGAESAPAPIQLALSNSSVSGRGLLALFVMTHTGTMAPSAGSDAKVEDKPMEEPLASQGDLARTEPYQTPGALPDVSSEDVQLTAASPGKGNSTFDIRTVTELLGQAPLVAGQQGQSSPVGASSGQVAQCEPQRLAALPNSAMELGWSSEMTKDACVVPEWVGWVAAAGILSLASCRALRCFRGKSLWSRQRWLPPIHKRRNQPNRFGPHGSATSTVRKPGVGPTVEPGLMNVFGQA